MSASISVLIADDHPLMRAGISAILSGQDDIEVVAEAADGCEALECYRRLRPQITIMDVAMPVMCGLTALREIRRECAQAQVIMLSTYKKDAQILGAIHAGAAGFLTKNSLRNELLDAVRTARAGRLSIHPEIALEMSQHWGSEALTPREVDVLGCVAKGASNQLIADSLEISEDTVKAHMKRILSKLGANDRTHAVTIALRRGILL
ncbi:response regulator transcription factor [Duganella callida]|uniref:Response regulator transcription factor n=1 Tax=Duganella callida TaxID=2561932 RepID=A0A4Y9SK56_9BURK|nr:response regulator transcription factor [Duganella callida]TFW26289.1 response regulator transcription factor [Duganella callida]